MNCQSCGREIGGDARVCENCGKRTRGDAPPNPPPYVHVPNHLVWAILATIFCCMPAGVVSIVYAAQVNGMLDAGDYRGARRASRNAKIWAIASMALAAAINLGTAAAYAFWVV